MPDDLKDLVGQFKKAIKEKTGRIFRKTLSSSCGEPSGRCSDRGITTARLRTGKCTIYPKPWGTAVNVIAMVFGNMGETFRNWCRLYEGCGNRGPTFFTANI